MNLNVFAVLTLVVLLNLGTGFCSRSARSLIFNKGSRFFVRINVKDNLLKNTNTFAHAVGYRMAWDLPDKVNSNRRVFRRDLYQGIETLLTKNRINGEICMKKFVCEARFTLKRYNHFLSRLIRHIFTPDKDDDGHYVPQENCKKKLWECPVSLLSFI